MGLRRASAVRILKKSTSSGGLRESFVPGDSFRRIHARNFTTDPSVSWNLEIDQRDWEALLAGAQRLVDNPTVFVPFEVPGRGKQRNILLTPTFDGASPDWNYELKFHRRVSNPAEIDGFWWGIFWKGSARDRMEVKLDPKLPGVLQIVPDDPDSEVGVDFGLEAFAQPPALHRFPEDLALLQNFLRSIADPTAVISSRTSRR
jgi:hypothetical protein